MEGLATLPVKVSPLVTIQAWIQLDISNLYVSTSLDEARPE